MFAWGIICQRFPWARQQPPLGVSSGVRQALAGGRQSSVGATSSPQCLLVTSVVLCALGRVLCQLVASLGNVQCVDQAPGKGLAGEPSHLFRISNWKFKWLMLDGLVKCGTSDG